MSQPEKPDVTPAEFAAALAAQPAVAAAPFALERQVARVVPARQLSLPEATDDDA